MLAKVFGDRDGRGVVPSDAEVERADAAGDEGRRLRSPPWDRQPVAVVLDGDRLATSRMQELATWLNVAETTFVLPARDADTDYRVRIVTVADELPFAGHPTLGTCHAWLDAGHQPRDEALSCRNAPPARSASGARGPSLPSPRRHDAARATWTTTPAPRSWPLSASPTARQTTQAQQQTTQAQQNIGEAQVKSQRAAGEAERAAGDVQQALDEALGAMP